MVGGATSRAGRAPSPALWWPTVERREEKNEKTHTRGRPASAATPEMDPATRKMMELFRAGDYAGIGRFVLSHPPFRGPTTMAGLAKLPPPGGSKHPPVLIYLQTIISSTVLTEAETVCLLETLLPMPNMNLRIIEVALGSDRLCTTVRVGDLLAGDGRCRQLALQAYQRAQKSADPTVAAQLAQKVARLQQQAPPPPAAAVSSPPGQQPDYGQDPPHAAAAAASPPELRIDVEDGNPYTKEEFVDAYGGTAEWETSPRAAAAGAAAAGAAFSQPSDALVLAETEAKARLVQTQAKALAQAEAKARATAQAARAAEAAAEVEAAAAR